MTFFFLLIFCITLKLSLSIAATKLGCRSFFPFFVSLSNSSQKKNRRRGETLPLPLSNQKIGTHVSALSHL
jgi:hypothetical protein